MQSERVVSIQNELHYVHTAQQVSIQSEVSCDSTRGINMPNWSLSHRVNVLFRSTMNSVQHHVDTAQQVSMQYFDTTC